MSCVVAVALPRIALLVADTRLNLGLNAGTLSVHDEGAVEITDTAGDVMQVTAQQRKLRRTGFGWAAGAGNFLLVQALLRELQPLPDATECLRAAERSYSAQAATCQQELLNNPERLHAVILSTYWDGASFRLWGHDFRTHTPTSAQVQYVFAAPPELPPDTNAAVRGRLQTELVVDASDAGLRNNLRLIAALLHTVYQNSTTVSDRSEIGIIENRRSANTSRYLQGTNSQILAATNNQLQHLLQRA